MAKRKDPKFVDNLYNQYGNVNNLSHDAQARIKNIIDKNDGDVDYAKLNKYAQKQGWDMTQQNQKLDRGQPEEFRTGLK